MRRVLFVLAAMQSAVVAAPAAAQSVPFAGIVLQTCTVVATPGTLAPNAAFNVLSSKEAGGLAGGANILATNAAFRATLAGPSSFTLAPSGGDSNVTWLTEYVATGASTASGDTGTAPSFAVGTGLTTVSLDATATKPTNDYFPAGAYSAVATVTCAP